MNSTTTFTAALSLVKYWPLTVIALVAGLLLIFTICSYVLNARDCFRINIKKTSTLKALWLSLKLETIKEMPKVTIERCFVMNIHEKRMRPVCWKVYVDGVLARYVYEEDNNKVEEWREHISFLNRFENPGARLEYSLRKEMEPRIISDDGEVIKVFLPIHFNETLREMLEKYFYEECQEELENIKKNAA